MTTKVGKHKEHNLAYYTCTPHENYIYRQMNKAKQKRLCT